MSKPIILLLCILLQSCLCNGRGFDSHNPADRSTNSDGSKANGWQIKKVRVFKGDRYELLDSAGLYVYAKDRRYSLVYGKSFIRGIQTDGFFSTGPDSDIFLLRYHYLKQCYSHNTVFLRKVRKLRITKDLRAQSKKMPGHTVTNEAYTNSAD